MSSDESVKMYHLTEQLKAQGRYLEAENAYRSALNVDSHSLQLWWALGDLYAQTENFSGVEDCCRRIIAQDPGIAEVWLYYGMALQRQNKLEDAEAALQTALRLNTAFPDAFYHLGIVQQSLGSVDAAIGNYLKALAAMPDKVSVLFNLSTLFQGKGSTEEAFSYAFQALEFAPHILKCRRHFAGLLNRLSPAEVTGTQLAEILRSFDTPGLDVSVLMKPCMLILGRHPDVSRAIQLAMHDDQKKFKAELLQGGLDMLSGNLLLHKLLLHTKIPSPEFEKLLCAVRRVALDRVAGEAWSEQADGFGGDSGFMEALACQFFNNDYAAFLSREEQDAVDALGARLNLDIVQDEPAGDAFVARLTVYCMYMPLTVLENIAVLMERASDVLRSSLPVLFRRQWVEYQEELALRSDIEALTAINAGVSAQVRQQYEESLYPRWFSVDLYDPLACSEFLRTVLPNFDAPAFCDGPVEILVAGCGTGHHAIMLTARIANSHTLAVDLSRASLAYAMRKAHEADVPNIRFAQADILELGALESSFHVIESVGVLHHMREPL